MRLLIVAISLLLATLPLSARAGFTEGMQAYKKGAYAVAFDEWLELAMKGDAKAQNNIGILFRRGLGVHKDPAKAVEWYRQAADQEFAKAQYNLGLMYKQGEGVEKDLKQAITWYTRSAENGYARARFALGLRYERGAGVKQDPVIALKWYNLALDSATGKLERGVIKARNRVQKSLTSKEISEAEQMARDFDEDS